jgi:hypothetical protein
MEFLITRTRKSNVNPVKADERLSHPEEVILAEIRIAEYAILLDEARANGAGVAFMPSTTPGVWNTPDHAAFLARMKSLFRPEEKIVDFNFNGIR